MLRWATKKVRLPKYATPQRYEHIEWRTHRWCGYWAAASERRAGAELGAELSLRSVRPPALRRIGASARPLRRS
jgi:hypothetical protein